MRPPHFIVKFLAKRNSNRVKHLWQNKQSSQEKLLLKILKGFKTTGLGDKFHLNEVHSVEDFNRLVQVTTDLDYEEHSERLKKENPINWVQKGKLKYLAKTSGSTAASKYIYYTDSLIKNFKRFSTNLLFHFCDTVGRYDVLDKNVLVSPANPKSESNNNGLTIGYATGLMTTLAPKFSRKIVRPSHEILYLETVEEKIEAMAKEAVALDIRSFSCVPSFAIAVLEGVFVEAKARGIKAETIRDIWPNFIMYIYSGSALGSYEQKLKGYLGEDVPFFEVYSATETPIAYQYKSKAGELILDLDSAFFQFQTVGSSLTSKRLGVQDVKVGTAYRILMTTYGGLMSYRIGDIVEFLDTEKAIIKVVGREKEEVTIAGPERMSLDLVKEVLNKASTKFNIKYSLFFLCPYYSESKEKGYHWCLETDDTNQDVLDEMAVFLDTETIKINSGYERSRDSNSRLTKPKVSAIKPGSIDDYIYNNKQFGQGKFLTIHNEIDEPNRFFSYINQA